MKTWLKLTTILIALASPYSWAASDGRETNNGGYTCQVPGREVVPCDLFFNVHGNRDNRPRLPYDESQYFRFQDLPEVTRTEFIRIQRFLRIRTHEKVYFPQNFDFQRDLLVNTRTFSGEDEIGKHDSFALHQYGFAYSVVMPEEKDGSSYLERKHIIEVDLDYLKTLSPRMQALALMHELLHFELGGRVDSISPIVKGVHLGLVLHEEQRKGNRRLLTQSELETLNRMQEALVDIGATWVPGGGLVRRSDGWGGNYHRDQVHPNGGGLVRWKLFKKKHRAAKPQLEPSNFVGVTIDLRADYPGPALHWKNEILENRNDLNDYAVFERSVQVAGQSRHGMISGLLIPFQAMDRADQKRWNFRTAKSENMNQASTSIGVGIHTRELDGQVHETGLTLRLSNSLYEWCQANRMDGECSHGVRVFKGSIEGRLGVSQEQSGDFFIDDVNVTLFDAVGDFGGGRAPFCSLRFLDIHSERLPGQLGRIGRIDAMGTSCGFIRNLLNKGDLELRISASAAFGDGGFWQDAEQTPQPTYATDEIRTKDTMGFTFDGNIGLNYNNRIDLSLSASRSSPGHYGRRLSRKNVEAELSLRVGQHTYLVGNGYSTNYDFSTAIDENGTVQSSQKMNVKGMNLGLRIDFDMPGTQYLKRRRKH